MQQSRVEPHMMDVSICMCVGVGVGVLATVEVGEG